MTNNTKIIHENQSIPLDHKPEAKIRPKHSSCFIPLSLASQCGYEQVLYYNASAPADELYECATQRIRSVIHLLESLYEFDKAEAEAFYAVSSVSALLLNDAMSLLEEFNPAAIRLRKQSTN